MAVLLVGLAASWHGGQLQLPRGRAREVEGRSGRVRAMFSGIVEEMGTVSRLEKVARTQLWDGTTGEGWEMDIAASTVLEGASLGCSIAVNGVCLTVTQYDQNSFSVGLAPETIRLTNLASLKSGDPVNLERALAADGRNSGHFVQGHVDSVGTIEELTPDGDSLFVKVGAAVNLEVDVISKYVEKSMAAVVVRLDALEAKLAS
ncbi:MAG: hypothetical protein SGPRY_006687, partial [Prymnesium sp.]